MCKRERERERERERKRMREKKRVRKRERKREKEIGLCIQSYSFMGQISVGGNTTNMTGKNGRSKVLVFSPKK